jgi:hypothetical protein
VLLKASAKLVFLPRSVGWTRVWLAGGRESFDFAVLGLIPLATLLSGGFSKFLLESLILAQDERWRRA